MRRFIIEMGMGNSQYSQDYTQACARAIEDAIRHSSVPLFDALGVAHDDMLVRVTVAVQDPDQVDCAALAGLLPRGRAEVRTVHGGLNVTNPDSGVVTVIAQAAVEAFLPEMG